MHAGELARLQRLVLQDPLIHLQRLRGHGQAQAGRVIPCLGEVQRLETVRGMSGLIGIQHTDWPGITGKRQPGYAVLMGVDVEERGRGIVIGRDTFRGEQGLVASRRRIGIELPKIAVRCDLVGLPDRAVEQHIQVTRAQGAPAQSGLDLAILGEERIDRVVRDQSLAQGQDR